MRRLLRVGLTGGIGSGKSTVAALLGILGAAVYVADDRAKRLMTVDEGLVKEIIDLFGEQAYGIDGELNRKYLAERIFGEPELRLRMNRLVHPAVGRDFDSWAEEIEGLSVGDVRRPEYVVEEAAVLIESGAAAKMDRVVVVLAPEELRIRRVMDRDGVAAEAARARIVAQMSDAERLTRADYVIVADDRQLLIPQVVRLHEELSMLSP